MPRLKNINREARLNADGVGTRVGSRLKKAKIVFDPSNNNLPKRSTRALSMCSEPPRQRVNNFTEMSKKPEKRSTSPPNLDANVIFCCMICGKVEPKKGKKLIACKDCNYKVHSSCLKISYLNHALLEEHWRCDNCRMCVVCYETAEAGPLVSCCVCVDAYHLSCHSPKLQKGINKLKWECSKCQNIEKNTTSRKLTADSRKRLSPIPSEIYIGKKIAKSDSREKIDSNSSGKNNGNPVTRNDAIPDISDWSSERVSKYFEKEFPNEAKKFKEHDIDGASLLLVKRSDVVSGMSLKLGPAIRIYTRIVQLQSKSNDPRLTWM
ncbi:unnamed protein product [Hermetia illucens]|uniref:PHD-type domain-containing protein n=1 Tax=Hermetia illucens TaxID=343691 RepID=A0A7R8V0U1_HERIL|nr:PHD finger protein 10 [Hermetia illucens]XP_037919980.1 PHD finger protein 10 [Hermetia illucens]CAD7090593.1 unnamed protein product [Hermetia illucens]